MKVKIVSVNEENFAQIPRPAQNSFNCQECFFWMGKKDGRANLVRVKLNWLLKREKKYEGSLAKMALEGKEGKPIGFIQYGPIADFETAKLYYRTEESEVQRTSGSVRKLPIPKGGWCVTCVAIRNGYRRQGIALELIRSTLKDLKKRGVKSIDVYPLVKISSVGGNSQGPAKLWEKAGFKALDHMTHSRGEPLFGKGEEVLVMRKTLNG